MRRLACLALAFVLAGAVRGQDLDAYLSELTTRRDEPAAVKTLDPKRIINESNHFLKEREPDMTAEEYAIYEQVMTMLSTNPEFALNLLTNIMGEKKESSPAFEFILGNVQYGAGRVEQAEKHYRSAVERYPNFVRAWINLGILYYTAGRTADAIPALSTAVTLGDRHPATLGLLACCLEREGDLVAAENSFLQAISGEPLNQDWQEGLLRIYVATKQYGPGENVARGLIKRHPGETRYWLTYANILLSSGRKAQALVVLEAARGTGMAGPDELTLLGDLYAERNLVPEALAAYGAVHAKAIPQGEARLLRYARVLLGAGRAAEAEQALEPLAAKVTPAIQADFLLTRADILLARQNLDGAKRDLDALLAADPMHGPALLRLGRVHLRRENYTEAQFAFEAAYRRPDSTYHASLELANLELRNHHYPEVVQYLEKALTLERSEAVVDLLQQVQALLVEK